VLTLLFLGYVSNKKGLFDLLDVLKENKELYQNKIQLVIGGNGEIDTLKKYLKENKLDDLVQFVGWISNVEKAGWLKKADIFVLPSYFEGLPISILEAMSYGHPIITTNVGGIPEIVMNNKNGVICEPGNKEELKNAIDFFIQQPEKIKEFGFYSSEISKKYLPDSVMQELMNIYKTLLTK
jgi:glycosyltransferase involved in cell wall biosynthesis